MAKKPATYWQKRFEIYEARSNLKSQSHIKSLEKEYRAAQKAVEKDLKVFYSRLAANNDLPDSVAAKKLLDKNELADFKMSLKEYTALAKENGITGDFTKQLENASLKYRISRLEAMKLQLEQKATMLMHGQKTGLEKFAKSAYESAYYNGGFEIVKGTGVGKSLFQLDDKKINTVIHKPWAADGKNFSTRVWGQHRPQLVKNLHRSLTDALTRGTGPDKAIAAISHDFDVSMSAAARLVQTEEAYFSSVAQRDVFAELDVEQYQIIATLDGHTSEICRDLDNKVFNMDEYEAGVTAPPFHPRCRTTTAPYFDDEVDATRAARDPETGQTVQVPADMNYQQWKDNYTVDPATGKTPAQMKAEKKAQEEAAAAAKAKAEAEAKAQAEAAQKAKEAEEKAKAATTKKPADDQVKAAAKKAAAAAKAKATKAAKTPEAIISELEGKKYTIGNIEYSLKGYIDPKWTGTKDALQKEKATLQYFVKKGAATKDDLKKLKFIETIEKDAEELLKAKAAATIEKTRPGAPVSNIVGREKVDANTYSKARKDAAYWGKNGTERDMRMIDNAFREHTGEVWRNAPEYQREAIWEYTGSYYNKMNANLAGYEFDEDAWKYGKKLGVGKVALEKRTLDMTEYLERSVLKADVWCNRGTGADALSDFFESLGMTKAEFARAWNTDDKAFFEKMLGKKGRIYNFLSTAPVRGKGFGGDVVWNIYVPKGSHAAYVEPFSMNGLGHGKKWDGIAKQNMLGDEIEIILQRGGSYKVTKLEKVNGQMYIDVELHPEDGWDLYGQPKAKKGK